jgi:hypothetical protein
MLAADALQLFLSQYSRLVRINIITSHRIPSDDCPNGFW